MYRDEELAMQEHEVDRMAAEIGGPVKAETLIERAVDRLTMVLAGAVGTRSWGA